MPGPPSLERHVQYAIAMLVAIAGVVVAVNIKPIPLAAEVKITTDPAGAEVFVDSKLEGRGPMQAYVNPGQHKFEARAAGYEPSSAIWQNFEDGGSGFVNIKLTAIPAFLQIASDLTIGTVRIEGGRTDLIPREGSILLRMPVTSKSVEVASGNMRLVLPVEIKPGQMPEFNGNVLAANAQVAAIAYGAGKAYAEASYSPVDLYIDGKLVTRLVADGQALPALSPGPHRVRLVDGARVFERPILITEQPGVAVLISGAEQNLGNLIVKCNVEGAQILIDGAEFRSASTVGENFIANLRVRQISVDVRKQGMAVQEPKLVWLKRGETATVTFELQPESAAPEPAAAVPPPPPPQQQ
jgi:hypothetical protein